MPLNINSSTASFDAVRNLELTSTDFAQAVRRLSSGLRINSAEDDPAGLGISESLLAQSNGFEQVQRNVQDSGSLLNTAQAGLDQIQSALQRMNQLALQAANGTLSASDRQNIQLETIGLISEIDQVSRGTQYNNRALLDGTAGGAVVSGGGANITNIQAQAGVVPDGSVVVLSGAVQATASAIQGGAAPASPTFVGGGSVAISGPTGQSATFTSFSGEDISTFIQQVNDAGIGVSATTNAGGQVVLTSKDYGTLDAVLNPTGAQVITATGSAGDVDFGNGAGAQLELVAGSGATSGSVNSAGTFAAAAPINATLTVTVSGSVEPATTLTGVNSDQYNGGDLSAGVTFRVTNPGSMPVVPGDTFTVTQNAPLQLQTGANAGQTASLSIDAQSSLSLGVNGVDLTSQAGAEAALGSIQNAISQVASTQSRLGGLQNALTDTQNFAASAQENLLQARSNLVDANIPDEVLRFARDQILLQAGTAVLAQANQVPGLLLSLLSPGASSIR